AELAFCCLGARRGPGGPAELSEAVASVVQAMQATGVRRLLLVAAAGVLDHPEGGYRSAHVPPALREISAAHVRNFEAVRDAGLDYTVMAPRDLRDDVPR